MLITLLFIIMWAAGVLFCWVKGTWDATFDLVNWRLLSQLMMSNLLAVPFYFFTLFYNNTLVRYGSISAGSCLGSPFAKSLTTSIASIGYRI